MNKLTWHEPAIQSENQHLVSGQLRKNIRPRWAKNWACDMVTWYWSADTLFWRCQLIMAELLRAEGARAKHHSLENLVTHQAEKIWLWRHRTSDRATERPSERPCRLWRRVKGVSNLTFTGEHKNAATSHSLNAWSRLSVQLTNDASNFYTVILLSGQKSTQGKHNQVSEKNPSAKAQNGTVLLFWCDV